MMAPPVSTLSLPSIPWPQYKILVRENSDFHAEIPPHETVLQFLRPCYQRVLSTQRDSTALQLKKMSSVGEGRIFWNSMADLLTSSSFFPITINVPDMLSAMGGFITQLPIINRIYLYLTQESTPRKKKKKKKPPLAPAPAPAAQAHPVKSTGYSVRNRRVKNRRKKH